MAALDAVNKAAFAASIFKRGQKAELFDDAAGADEQTELRGKLAELHDVWALERTGRDLAAAIWRPELGVAEVVLQKGKLLPHMGFNRGSKMYLFIEEAVYLVDRANLLLFLDQGRQQQRLLSLQEAHDLMLSAGVTLGCYLVFCKLLRAGYICQRHPARWVLRPTEAPKQAWAGWGQPAAVVHVPAAAASQQQQGEAAAAAATTSKQQQPVSPASAIMAAAAAGPPPKRRKLAAQQPQQRTGTWWVSGTAAGEQQPQQQQEDASGADGTADGGGSGSANPWLRCLPAEFLDTLPRCEVLPGAAQRARADFPRMAPLQAIPLPDLQPLAGPAAGRHLLHYDVYNSNAKFSRKQPGKPVFVVAVVPCTRLPTPEDMAAADAAAGGTPVRFSTVEKGDICFYGISHVQLRSIL